MKVLIVGAKGYLGQEFLKVFPDALTPSVDIGDIAAVNAMLENLKPDMVINAAGKTGRPNVDWCEDHKEETVYANVTGAFVLMHACLRKGIGLVHLSSGCVYEGDNGGRGWSENDPPNFTGSFYSKSKIWSEEVLREFPVLILRLRMPFGDDLNERSLITKISKYSRVLDTENSLTYLPEFVRAAKTLMERKATGVYNVVNPGVLSPYRIMELYTEIVDPNHVFERLTNAQMGEVAKTGRSNCMLNGAKLASEGIVMSPAEDAVRDALLCIKNRGSNA